MVTTISYFLWHLHESLISPSAMLNRHAVYGDYRVTDSHWQFTASIALATVLSRLCESYRGFVSWCYQCRDNAYQEAISEFLLSMGMVVG